MPITIYYLSQVCLSVDNKSDKQNKVFNMLIGRWQQFNGKKICICMHIYFYNKWTNQLMFFKGKENCFYAVSTVLLHTSGIIIIITWITLSHFEKNLKKKGELSNWVNWFYSAVQKHWTSPHFFIFYFQWTRLFCNTLKWS